MGWLVTLVCHGNEIGCIGESTHLHMVRVIGLLFVLKGSVIVAGIRRITNKRERERERNPDKKDSAPPSVGIRNKGFKNFLKKTDRSQSPV